MIPADDAATILWQKFTTYLRASREDSTAFSTLPPGRFLMPGDLEGSPLLTFCPLALGDNWVNPEVTVTKYRVDPGP